MSDTDTERKPKTKRRGKGNAEWVPSGLPKQPVDHQRARLAAFDPDGAAATDTCYGDKSPF